jgi:hypothetical protein
MPYSRPRVPEEELRLVYVLFLLEIVKGEVVL